MYSPLQLGFKYFQYYVHAANGKGHGIHSPFVYEFIREVLNDNRHFYSYNQIEAIRNDLLHNTQQLTIEDFGAGSRTGMTKQRVVNDIAKSSLKPKKFAQLMFRMVDHYQPNTIVELGTSLGITTSYLAAAKPTAQVITMEGSTAIAAIAQQNFQQQQMQNIKVVVGNFDETLSATIAELNTIDFAFLDGNHRYQPTIDYFKQVLTKVNHQSIIILDDIHWSKEMEQAWEEVKQHPKVTTTIDLFFIGIVLLKPEFKEKQHFVIRF